MYAILNIPSEKDKVNQISNMDSKDTPVIIASNENYDADDEGIKGTRNRAEKNVRKRGSGEADFEDIKRLKKPTVTKKIPIRYITERNTSSCGLERKNWVKCSISCDPLCQSQSTYSYEDELLRLLDSVTKDALNGAKMRYINTAVNIPVYRVKITESRLNKSDTKQLQTWEVIYNSDQVFVSIREINNEDDNSEASDDNLEYYYICFLAKARLPDVNLADIDEERDTFSHTSETEYDERVLYARIRMHIHTSVKLNC
ncbi:hypothetical protein B5S28_g2629 [[Candida] boidinii]|nr:hypothetical protein B5S28_g2629 [[Candida] boidinii]OWB62708.1 hypothetical protein B5S29_g3649 [[Candida] boidinii]